MAETGFFIYIYTSRHIIFTVWCIYNALIGFAHFVTIAFCIFPYFTYISICLFTSAFLYFIFVIIIVIIIMIIIIIIVLTLT